MKTKIISVLAFVFFIGAAFSEPPVKSQSLISSSYFNKDIASRQILTRINHGIYDGYEAELDIVDPKRCESPIFLPYKKMENGKTDYVVKLDKNKFAKIPDEVKKAVIDGILYHTWGYPFREDHPPLSVEFASGKDTNPLDQLSAYTKKRYLQFASDRMLAGGKGADAYGPNCWYSSISAIADSSSSYARIRQLAKATWNQPRFMGATEFRFHMRDFEEVKTPQFGDIIRYYCDEQFYSGDVYDGELHAAIYIGRERYIKPDGKFYYRDIALTKNGRSDLDFLIFQDVAALDALYLGKLPGNSPLLKFGNGTDPRKKGYFRIKKGAALIDPAKDKDESKAYAAYLIDQINYKDRWSCLAGVTHPPHGGTCYTYPLHWLMIQGQ
ncbi:MAG TPA: hypothetical protein VG733_05050 [Chthoniobacteraceae bacterium]|nr:hypothetical protein [Chthoniobacteraceae bacterium]